MEHLREPNFQKAPTAKSALKRDANSRSGSYVERPTAEAAESSKGRQYRWKWGTAVLATILGLGGLAYVWRAGPSEPPAPISTQTQQNGLTLTSADVDTVATEQAIAAIKAGHASPLVEHLSDQAKQEILSGERKFYRLPMTEPDLQQAHAPANPSMPSAPKPPDPSSNSPTPQPPPKVQPAEEKPFQRDDRVGIAFNGVSTGTHNLGENPYTLTVPLKLGDTFTLTCVSVSQGKSVLTVKVATSLNPIVSRPLSPGQSQSWEVVSGSAHAQNFEWFEREAACGNATAQYGLAHMYRYGIGVPRNLGEAAKWYRLAAAQGYGDAQAQLTRLGQ